MAGPDKPVIPLDSVVLSLLALISWEYAIVWHIAQLYMHKVNHACGFVALDLLHQPLHHHKHTVGWLKLQLQLITSSDEQG